MSSKIGCNCSITVSTFSTSALLNVAVKQGSYLPVKPHCGHKYNHEQAEGVVGEYGFYPMPSRTHHNEKFVDKRIGWLVPINR